MPNPSHTALDVIRNEAIRLDGDARDYEALLDGIGERSLVLLGEATHGTREFYRMRAELTLRLVVEKGFDAVAVEADWPDAYRLNRFVRGEGHDQAARSAFDDFQRFPRWMWRNETTASALACFIAPGWPHTRALSDASVPGSCFSRELPWWPRPGSVHGAGYGHTLPSPEDQPGRRLRPAANRHRSLRHDRSAHETLQ